MGPVVDARKQCDIRIFPKNYKSDIGKKVTHTHTVKIIQKFTKPLSKVRNIIRQNTINFL